MSSHMYFIPVVTQVFHPCRHTCISSLSSPMYFIPVVTQVFHTCRHTGISPLSSRMYVFHPCRHTCQNIISVHLSSSVGFTAVNCSVKWHHLLATFSTRFLIGVLLCKVKKFQNPKKNVDRAQPIQTFVFGNPSLTWTKHSNHNN